MSTSSTRGIRGTAAFTLIELLTVIAIIGILASMISPVLSQAKRRTRDVQCLNNLRQQGIAYKVYMDDFQGRFPPGGVVEWEPSIQRYRGKPLDCAMGGINPRPGYFAFYFPQVTNRPLARYQGNPQIFRCPLDAGDLAYPQDARTYPPPAAKPSMWGTIGCSYLFNAGLDAPTDPTRLPTNITLRASSGTLPNKPEQFVAQPSRFLLVTEPTARPVGRLVTPVIVIYYWAQWHRRYARTDFTDPTIAPRMFVSPALFVDGHAGVYDFSDSVMNDPYFPFEPTKDWLWYEPAN